MKSTKATQTNQVKRFRVMFEDKPCKLITDFHELGCVVPASKGEQAAEFKTKIAADMAISRTYEAKNKAEASFFPEFKGFDPLRFNTRMLRVEEYMIDEPDVEDEE